MKQESDWTLRLDVPRLRRHGLFALIEEVRLAFGRFGTRGWVVAAGTGFATLMVVGVVTAIIENPLFVRMTPVRAQDYAIWLASGLFMGLIAGTFVGPAPARHQGKALSGGLLSLLAVGCPICNKLVVLLLGVSSALTVFGPVQLYLGALSVALLAWTFRLRVRAVARTCALPAFRPEEAGTPRAVPDS